MEEAITRTVLWAWIVGCGIWAWNQYRQSRRDHYQLWLRQVRRVRPVRRALFGVLLAALVLAGFADPHLATAHSGAGSADHEPVRPAVDQAGRLLGGHHGPATVTCLPLGVAAARTVVRTAALLGILLQSTACSGGIGLTARFVPGAVRRDNGRTLPDWLVAMAPDRSFVDGTGGRYDERIPI